MGHELFDLRAKITVEAQCALAAYARAHEVDKAEVVRDVLHRWAVAQIHGASLLASCMRAKGLPGAAAGIVAQAGDPLEWEES